jgi:surface protein
LAKAKYEARLKSTVDGMTVELSIPKKLKKMGRIIEKTLLKRKDDPGNANKVCDLVRGMVTCENMGQIATIVQRLGSSPDIVVTRIKDRFLTSPSGGGWRDCMLNFYLKEDSNQHVCEVQLVHQQMMTARKGLPGHAVYNRVRNADEIVNQWMVRKEPQTKKELQEWIVGWVKGDKITRGAPNSWDVRKVTDMSKLFDHKDLKEFNDPIGDWDVHNVVNMDSMFKGAKSFNQPIGQWQTENVTTMQGMFEYATSFNQPIGQWKTENANKGKMFYDAEAMEEKNKPNIK